MKSSRLALHEFSPHIPKKMSKGNIISTLIHKSPDMHYVKHKLLENTRPSHHVKHATIPEYQPIEGEPRSKQEAVIRGG
jgi:hypothetical protein